MKFLAGMITSSIFIAIVFIGCWLYFDFPISTNDEEQHNPKTQQVQQAEIQKENKQQQQQQQPQEQTEPPTIPAHQNNERLPNLHDKQKAFNLMKQERSSLSDEDKKIYDGVIETAKTNINNDVATQEDYNILNEYKK